MTETSHAIALSQGLVALVDKDDYPKLAPYKWYARWNRFTRSHYAIRNETLPDGTRISILMHREILGIKKGDSRQGDHAQHNTLDNRRLVDNRPNLRVATRSQNMRNALRRRDNTSGYKGVGYNKANRRYSSRIRDGEKRVHIGWFRNAKAAALAYDERAIKIHGEFAVLNFPRKEAA